jgi:hypothetical protein
MSLIPGNGSPPCLPKERARVLCLTIRHRMPGKSQQFAAFRSSRTTSLTGLDNRSPLDIVLKTRSNLWIQLPQSHRQGHQYVDLQHDIRPRRLRGPHSACRTVLDAIHLISSYDEKVAQLCAIQRFALLPVRDGLKRRGAESPQGIQYIKHMFIQTAHSPTQMNLCKTGSLSCSRERYNLDRQCRI